MIEDAGEIGGVLLHCGRAFACAGFTVSAQVGKNQLVARRESFSRRKPELVIRRKRVQKYYRRAGSQDLIRNLCVVAFEVDHLAEFGENPKSKRKKILNRKGR